MQYLRTDRKRKQGGFTLIELLVVVTILGILAAIVVLALIGITSNADKQACIQEAATVQSAMDADIANNSLGGVTQVTTPTNDWQTHPAEDPLVSQNLLRQNTTKYYYTYGPDGKLNGAFKDASSAAAPCSYNAGSGKFQ